MEAKDDSMAFDFEGEFTGVKPKESIQYKLADNREVLVEFIVTEKGIRVVETFEADDEYAAEQQRQSWLGILGHFKNHDEGKFK